LAHLIRRTKEIKQEILSKNPRYQDKRTILFCNSISTLLKKSCQIAQKFNNGSIAWDRSDAFLKKKTFVRFFNHPEVSSIPRHVIIKKDTKIGFLLAYARVSIRSSSAGTTISVDEMPWLKVRIDGKEGFVRDAEDLLALGIQPAG
jgi:hypothetical protein